MNSHEFWSLMLGRKSTVSLRFSYLFLLFEILGIFFFLFVLFWSVFLLNRTTLWSEILEAFCLCVLTNASVSKVDWAIYWSLGSQTFTLTSLGRGFHCLSEVSPSFSDKDFFECSYRCEGKLRRTCQPSAFPSHSTPHSWWANTGHTKPGVCASFTHGQQSQQIPISMVFFLSSESEPWSTCLHRRKWCSVLRFMGFCVTMCLRTGIYF